MHPRLKARFPKVPRTGAVATELAVTLPLLILLCLTTVDLGRFAYAYIAVGNTARVGAEYGATRRYDTAMAATWQQQIAAAMREDFSTTSELDTSLLNIQFQVTPDSYDLDRVCITASYPFTTVIAWPGIPQSIAMQRQLTFRRFR